MGKLWKLKPPVKSCTDFYVLDTETGFRMKDGIHWNLEGDFIFGVVYGYNYTRVFHTKKELIDALQYEPRFKGKKVFMHNAEFDLMVLYGNIFQLDPNAVFNGSRFIMCTNGNCTFADSANIFVGQSVAKIGEQIGIKKPELGNEKMISKSVGKDEINRCVTDCNIVWDALVLMFDFAGEIKVTQAALSMTYFRRYTMPYHIEYNDNVYFFWQSYFGGRTEAFKIGKTHAKVIDVNSMYPYGMRTANFPNPKFLKHDKNVKDILYLLYNYEGCVECKVFHPESYFGFLPVKHNGKLIFPIGKFSGFWNFNELRFAIENGVKILSVKQAIYAPPIKSPFVNFVDELMRLKIQAEIEGNEFERDRAKRYANSLYGKFAQRIDTEQIYLEDYFKQADLIRQYQAKGLYKGLQLFNKDRKDAFLLLKTSRKISHAIPSFASYITSFCRVLLLKKMLELRYNKIVYCDTDSIFFEIDTGIESEYELGGWKIENKIVTEIKGLKNYKFKDVKKGEVWRVKGVPLDRGKNTIIIRDNERFEFNTVTQTGTNDFEYYNLVKTKEALRHGKEARKITKRSKHIKNVYDKREVLTNGETKPIIL